MSRLMRGTTRDRRSASWRRWSASWRRWGDVSDSLPPGAIVTFRKGHRIIRLVVCGARAYLCRKDGAPCRPSPTERRREKRRAHELRVQRFEDQTLREPIDV